MQGIFETFGEVLGWLPLGLGALSILMTLDILSGITRCAITGEVHSSTLIKGVTVKAGALVVVGLAFGVDLLVTKFIPEAKSYAPGVMIGKVVAAWYMFGEVLSLLENLHRMGVPMPKFLVRFLKVARDHVTTTVQVPKITIEHVHVGHADESIARDDSSGKVDHASG